MPYLYTPDHFFLLDTRMGIGYFICQESHGG